MNATINLENKHFPVLLNELVNIISPLYGGTFIDCTFGEGGYSKKILEYNNNKVIGIDRDKDVISYANNLKKIFKHRFELYNIKFSKIDQFKYINPKGVIFDLGYSINQIHDKSKGLSFNNIGKLNMKMGLNKFSAHDVISKLNKEDLIQIFKFFGDEKFSKKIANKIDLERKKSIIKTEDLKRIINNVKRKNGSKIDRSTKVFQALRIFVNQEISELLNGLINAYNILPVGGVIAVVSFHSLEDKIVKFFFQTYAKEKSVSRYLPEEKKLNRYLKLIHKKPITPGEDEIINNPPSRSAKLRYGFKIKEGCEFKELKKKFEYLTNIENLCLKL